MSTNMRRALLVTIAGLIGVIAGLGAGLLTYFGGGHITDTIRDGCVGFAATTAFFILVMTNLGAL